MATQLTLNDGSLNSAGALKIKTNGTTEAVDISTGQVVTLAKDAVVNGLTVGRGAGAVSTNTAVGASALNANTTGSNNSAFGQNALLLNQGGSYNTGIGRNALYSNTSGVNNSAVGFNALSGTTTGSYNVALGYEALNANTTASYNAAFGYKTLYSNTTGTRNNAFGIDALGLNTTGSYNTAFGDTALGNNTTASNNTAVGYQAGYANTTGAYNTFIGQTSGVGVTTGTQNTFIGAGSGSQITTGNYNSILGFYNGNQGGLDIRTSSNYIVLSDGAGNPRLVCDNNGLFANQAYGAPSASYAFSVKGPSAGGGFLQYQGVNFVWASVATGTATTGFSTANACSWVSKDSVTSRSINAAGTVNTNGSDYAEYMVKAGSFTIAKGDVVGINAEGKLTNVFADAVSFVVKSTDPSYVGGDNWFDEEPPKAEDGTILIEGPEWDAYKVREEAARQLVDRIAFSGQVPVNVTGATAGQYIIPVNDNGAIKGEAVSNPTFEQYQQAVGKVIAIEQDGRARIIVKVA